ncbi:MAG: hypothetical protein IKN89_13950, partial [Oscillospiraceae bacterium]|nr:hypothetical protein [Oscillospiraceae bacterium]
FSIFCLSFFDSIVLFSGYFRGAVFDRCGGTGEKASPERGDSARGVARASLRGALARGMGTRRAAVGACYLWNREAVERSFMAMSVFDDLVLCLHIDRPGP